MMTRELLARDFADLGIRPGQTLLIHSSLRSLGWVCGGPTVVVQALLDVVGPTGTLAAPTQTLDNRDPSRWAHAPVTQEWWPTIRAHLPPFDPHLSMSTGALAERIRTWPGAVRSNHPLTSFAAVGFLAADLMAHHPLQSLLGADSPLGALERADARVLLLGVGFDKCTAFHLAEYRLPQRGTRMLKSVMQTESGREWVTYESAEIDDHDFAELGAAFEKTGSVSSAMVGAATGRLFPIRAAVCFAQTWIARHRHLRSAAQLGAGDESETR